jgi:hypothetical protein
MSDMDPKDDAKQERNVIPYAIAPLTPPRRHSIILAASLLIIAPATFGVYNCIDDLVFDQHTWGAGFDIVAATLMTSIICAELAVVWLRSRLATRLIIALIFVLQLYCTASILTEKLGPGLGFCRLHRRDIVVSNCRAH